MKELNKIKELFDDFIKEAEKLVEVKSDIQLEDNNFKVDSDGWKKITVDGEEYLENKEKDIWEILDKEARGEQLFTFKAMKRETEKAGKRVPTNEEFDEILKEKDDIPNLVLSGYRSTDGTFNYLGTDAYFWSSSEAGTSAWRRNLGYTGSTVNRGADDQALGFSVRCLKD